MCLVLVAWRQHPDFPLVVAANRDEWRTRPAEPLGRWADGLLAGRDVRAGGTWLAVRPDGAFAATTNLREPGPPAAGLRSRGELPPRLLRGPLGAAVSAIAAEAQAYGPFHVLAGDRDALWHLSNRGEGPTRLDAGYHGLSNGPREAPWPKVRSGLAALRRAVERGADVAELLALLDDPTPPPDAELPDTGVGLELERALAPRRIDVGAYGTRVSTVVRVGRGVVAITERSWDPGGGRVGLELPLARGPAG